MVAFSIDRKLFKRFIDITSSVVIEANMEIFSERLHIRSIDSANICIIDATLYCDTTSDDEGSVFIDLNKLSNILNKAKDDTIFLDINKNIMHIECGKMSADLTIYKNSSKPIPDVNIPFSVNMVLNGEQFTNAIKGINKLSEKIKFTAYDDHLNIYVNNNDDIYEWNVDIIESKESSEVEIVSAFPYEYVSDISGAVTSFESINLRYGNDTPFTMNCNDDNFDVEFILAPRITKD